VFVSAVFCEIMVVTKVRKGSFLGLTSAGNATESLSSSRIFAAWFSVTVLSSGGGKWWQILICQVINILCKSESCGWIFAVLTVESVLCRCWLGILEFGLLGKVFSIVII